MLNKLLDLAVDAVSSLVSHAFEAFSTALWKLSDLTGIQPQLIVVGVVGLLIFIVMVRSLTGHT
jgi:hypothetical protein